MSTTLITALIEAGIKYGPEFITSVKSLLSKKDPTIDDVVSLFANLKPYASYGIPDTAPTVAAT